MSAEEKEVLKAKQQLVSLYRVFVACCSFFAAGAAAISLYAGSAYVKAAATDAVMESVKPLTELVQPLPPRVAALEKMAAEREEAVRDYQKWKTEKDAVDIRMTVLLEGMTQLAARQQIQLDRQQALIDQLARDRH